MKKAIGSGHLSAQEALPFVLAQPGVTSVIVGTINAVHLRQNAELCHCEALCHPERSEGSHATAVERDPSLRSG